MLPFTPFVVVVTEVEAGACAGALHPSPKLWYRLVASWLLTLAILVLLLIIVTLVCVMLGGAAVAADETTLQCRFKLKSVPKMLVANFSNCSTYLVARQKEQAGELCSLIKLQPSHTH